MIQLRNYFQYPFRQARWQSEATLRLRKLTNDLFECRVRDTANVIMCFSFIYVWVSNMIFSNPVDQRQLITILSKIFRRYIGEGMGRTVFSRLGNVECLVRLSVQDSASSPAAELIMYNISKWVLLPVGVCQVCRN